MGPYNSEHELNYPLKSRYRKRKSEMERKSIHIRVFGSEKDFSTKWMSLVFLRFSQQRLMRAACEANRSCEIQWIVRCKVPTIKK